MIELIIGYVKIPLILTTFPAGEVHVRINDNEGYCPQGKVTLKANLRSSNDVLWLLNVTDAVRRKYGYDTDIKLIMPYIPYAQQDRVCNEGESLSINVFANLINSQGYSEVVVYDPHSDVAPALIDNCTVVEQHRFIENINLDKNNTILVSPDAGANKKTFKVVQKTGFQEFIRADKTRDTLTGDVTETTIFSSKERINGKDLLIVDDLCIGGKTFIELTKKLKELTTGDIYLYTTHGIYSKGVHVLINAGIKHLYTANPWCDNVDEDFITVVNY